MKIKIIIIINIVITIAFISIIGILLIKNNKEVHTWKNAIEVNESYAISNYIEQYPNGIFEKSAFQKIDELIQEEYESTGTFTDSRDSNVYKFVTIGNQVWMAENLKYLPAVVGATNCSYSTPYYYVYGYNGTDVTAAKATANYSTYGVLYNWPAAMAGSSSSNANPSGVQGVCPTGWHLPSSAEWTQLADYLGGPPATIGGKLKETGTAHWDSPNTGATNETGFTALPGGNRYVDGALFSYIGGRGYWWSALEQDTYSAWGQCVFNDNNYFGPSRDYYNVGCSVRCVRD